MVRVIAGLAGFVLLAAAGCSKTEKPVGGVNIATIEGQPISRDAYIEYLERKQVVQIQTPRGPEDARTIGTLGMQALRDLVNRKLLLQMAQKEGVMPTKEDIDKELAFQVKRRPDFVTLLTNQGLSQEMIRGDLEFDLARERLLTKNVTVTPAEVDKYVKEHPEQFTEPAQAELMYIFVSDVAKKAAVDKELADKQPFQVVAAKYSEAPQARELSATYPETRVGMMPPKLQELVAKTPELTVTNWQKDGKNWVKFYVRSKTPAKPIAMDDTQKEFLRRQMAMQRGEQANHLGQRLGDALRTADIEVTDSYLKGPWDKAFNETKNPSTQTPTPAK